MNIMDFKTGTEDSKTGETIYFLALVLGLVVLCSVFSRGCCQGSSLIACLHSEVTPPAKNGCRQTVVSVGVVHFSEYDQCSARLFCDVLIPNMNVRLKLVVE